MRLLLAFAALLVASPLAAQDTTATDTTEAFAGCTFTAVTYKKQTAPDSGGVALPSGEAVTVTLVADSACAVADGDGYDGSISLGLPDGLYDVLARVTGKKGGSASVSGTGLERKKGKGQWTAVGDSAVTIGSVLELESSAKTVQLRFLPVVPEPAEPPAEE